MGVKFLIPNFELYSKKALPLIEKILNSNMVTNSQFVSEFEKITSNYIGRGVVATSSCTSSMMIGIKALGLKHCEIIVPSFTFCSTAHAVEWNNCRPVFADADPETFNIDIEDVKSKITPKTKAILATHVFGNPCNIKALSDMAKDKNLHLCFDAAHGFGASYENKKIGSFASFEAFSLSPTKLLSTMEGGLVTSSDENFLAKIKVARNYGSPPDYNCTMHGLNSRMTEINALIGTLMLEDLDKYVENRNKYAEYYKKKLSTPGVSFQKIEPNSVTTYKDFAIVVDEKEFGMNRNQLTEHLHNKGIESKKYFYPPIHKMGAYKEHNDLHLHVTEKIANNILCLPIHSIMSEETLDFVCGAVLESGRK